VFFEGKWIQLEDIILSEISQDQKNNIKITNENTKRSISDKKYQYRQG
jgi:hypothetical protein